MGAAKALAHWLAAGLPLILATPVLGLLLNLDASATAAVALTLRCLLKLTALAARRGTATKTTAGHDARAAP